MSLSETLFQNPFRMGARKPLISWTRGNRIAILQIQVTLERITLS
jgi:hypothetical protein